MTRPLAHEPKHTQAATLGTRHERRGVRSGARVADRLSTSFPFLDSNLFPNLALAEGSGGGERFLVRRRRPALLPLPRSLRSPPLPSIWPSHSPALGLRCPALSSAAPPGARPPVRLRPPERGGSNIQQSGLRSSTATM